MKINFKRIFIMGILLGLVLLFLRYTLRISDGDFNILYVVVAIAIIIGSVLINVHSQWKFMQKLMKLQLILTEEKNPDLFIEENEKLLETLRPIYNRSLCTMNISNAYCEKKDFEKAKEVLLSLDVENLKGINKTIYCINLVYLNFLLGENETAITVFDKYQSDFAKLENHSSLGKNIAINTIYYYIAKGENTKALDLFTITKSKYNDENLADDFNHFDEILNETFN